MAEDKKYLTYRGKRLARKDNIIYYGNPEDNYVIMMNITGSQKNSGYDITSKVTVSLQTNSGGTKERIVRQVEKEGLFKALDMAEFWLSDALDDEQNA